MATSLEILAPYLPYGIALQTPLQPARVLSGLHDGNEPSASCKTPDGWESGLGLEYILPILRPFSALCEPLEDGTVPAVEVAKMLFLGASSQKIAVARYMPKGQAIDLLDAKGARLNILWAYQLEQGGVPLKTADYLRSKHFAVGLEPGQYIEKVSSAAPIDKNTAL